MTPEERARELRISLDLTSMATKEAREKNILGHIKAAREDGQAELLWLLEKCEEVVDDDLENRPARHSLGKLHVDLVRSLEEITPPGTCPRCRGKGVEASIVGDERVTWPCLGCKKEEIVNRADKACQACRGTGIYDASPLRTLVCSCAMTFTPVVKP